VRAPGIRGRGCVMDGMKAGWWNDCAGEPVGDACPVGDGDELGDELAPRGGGGSSWLPYSSW
jgi:hypothetical protein